MNKEEAAIRITQIQAILENNLYENECEEMELINEREELELINEREELERQFEL